MLNPKIILNNIKQIQYIFYIYIIVYVWSKHSPIKIIVELSVWEKVRGDTHVVEDKTGKEEWWNYILNKIFNNR